jgi:hypothetical protein
MTFEPNMKYDLEILSYLYGIEPEDEDYFDDDMDEYNYGEDYPNEDDLNEMDDQA